MGENIRKLIWELPKVEQHIHIVGSIRPNTLLWLLSDSNIEQTGLWNLEKVQSLFQYRDFSHFIECYSLVTRSIRKEKQFERIVYEMLEDEAKQNVKYVEASFSAPDHTRLGLGFSETLKAINRGADKAHLDFGVECNLKIDLVRDYGPDAASMQLELISTCQERVVAIDIGGRENSAPARNFEEVYRRAAEMGLRLTAHAGEVCGPQSIWEAVNILGAERIGHGVSAREDSVLLEHLKRRNVTIETCPVSNLKTKVVNNIREHPIRMFFERGLKVTVNSDDPTMFETNMNNEYNILHNELGFTLQNLYHLSLNGIDSSFLSDEKKTRLRETFRSEFERLT